MGSLFLEGLLLQASLIFALGAQNLFVLECGLKRQHQFTVSFVCFICDLTLIMLGVAGAATMFNHYPLLKVVVGMVGVGFLFYYGVSKLLPVTAVDPEAGKDLIKSTLKKSILLSITFSILNPHAYLDAFILIGGFASKYEVMNDRLIFGLGAAIFSGIWFLLISSLSSVMKPLLSDPRRMRGVMSVAGLFLIFLSIKLGSDVLHWVPEGLLADFAYGDLYTQAPGTVFTSILY
ncbi:MAG TPA: LysE family transporter [Bacteriovoracaceae bacterium]|nr:LysE family transporter [Bacteriovoracaceae bacterium]